MLKKTTNKDLILFIICCFVSVILFFSKDLNSLNKTRSHIHSFFSIIYSPKDFFSNLSDLKNKNDSLIIELKDKLQENEILKQRIRDAQEYYKYIANPNLSYTLIPAKVLNHSVSASSKILNLDIGFKNGVPNDYKAVISLNGNLVGRTYFVSDYKTQVHKINDKNFHVLIKTKDNIKGQFTYKSGNRGVIESISNRDLPTVQALAIILASIYVSINLVADLLTLMLNPRLKTLQIRK